MMKQKENDDDSFYSFLYQIPPKEGRYIILDLETTGLSKTDHVIEIGAIEIKNLDSTGDEYHFYIKPRKIMDQKIISIHGISNTLYSEYYEDIYPNDRNNLLLFCNWLQNSIIFTFNAIFDSEKLNKELIFHGLNVISIYNFRCIMRIFKEIVGIIDPLKTQKYLNLNDCCEYFGIKIKRFNHNALEDSYMALKLLQNLYALIDKNKTLYKNFDYNIKNDLSAHYKAYKKQREINKRTNSYYDDFFIKRNLFGIAFPPYKKKKKINNKIDSKKNEKINENSDTEFIEKMFKDLDSK